MFTRILIANRGEIARRIIRSCKRLGIESVAVYTPPDRGLAFVSEADHAVALDLPTDYLNSQALIECALRLQAQAIHPGYGFLAESAAFASQVAGAGLVFIGPSPAAMQQMADKRNARQLAERCGVPVLPGFDKGQASDEMLVEAAQTIGYPLLIKAACGGGGRGMRRVDRPAGLADALASARREAAAAFGDDSLLLERALDRPRHIEVQVIGDQHGTRLHLGERECSIQRRFQKVIEEAPSAAVDDALRERLGDAALKLASAIDYYSLGTVEFLLDSDGAFYFLEMNTRLQVEHPVTELVTGIDLVEEQIRVAEGQRLVLAQDQIVLRGHAIEARVCAEDPSRQLAPVTGRLAEIDFGSIAGLRVDSGYRGGDSVSEHYDSLVAKLIFHASDRATAIRGLRYRLQRAIVSGIATNLPVLRAVLDDIDFIAGRIDTGLIDRHDLVKAPPLNIQRTALAATVLMWLRRGERAVYPAGVRAGWRQGPAAEQKDIWQSFIERCEVYWRCATADNLDVSLDGTSWSTVFAANFQDNALRFEWDGTLVNAHVVELDQIDGEPQLHLHFGDAEGIVHRLPRFVRHDSISGGGLDCHAPTPGSVTAVHVAIGDSVSEGQALISIEAMKMEQTLRANREGRVRTVTVAVGDKIAQGQLLVGIEEESAEQAAAGKTASGS
ncbi:MAG: ATP-grasp domain-containing protein [Deltaproteobacteria bacterium]|nr:ATP-grasp domain-containing protein [Deltaproteobacteria bacterium]